MRHRQVEHTHQGTSVLPSTSSAPYPPSLPPSRPSHPTISHYGMVYPSYTLLHGVITRYRNHKYHTKSSKSNLYGHEPYCDTLIARPIWHSERTAHFQFHPLRSSYLHTKLPSPPLLPISVLSGLMLSQRGNIIGGRHSVVVGAKYALLTILPILPTPPIIVPPSTDEDETQH